MGTTPELTNFQLVNDDGHVTIASRWMPLVEGEEVIAATATIYEASTMDYLLALFTMGIYYCTTIKAKQNETSAVILTTKRILEMIVHHPKSKVPSGLGRLEGEIDSDATFSIPNHTVYKCII